MKHQTKDGIEFIIRYPDETMATRNRIVSENNVTFHNDYVRVLSLNQTIFAVSHYWLT